MSDLVIGIWLFAGAGLVLRATMAVVAARWLARTPVAPTRQPVGLSILKPLCGLDDDLEANLECFAALTHEPCEVLLGVASVADASYPIAVRLARRHPRRFRVIVQEGAPGLNPKVNQLITLARKARHDWLWVSDSNARVAPGAASEIVALLADPGVGLVTSPVVGAGETRLGARLDNLHLSGCIAPAMIASQVLARKDFVVGKSMALRRSDLDQLGGFAAVKDVLAEDYVLGRRVAALGKRVAIARTPVVSWSRGRSLGELLRRYQRWSLMQRKMAGLATYLAVPLLMPSALALLGFVLAPGLGRLGGLAGVWAARAGMDAVVGGRLGVGMRRAWAAPLADVAITLCWAVALLGDQVVWRGRLLRVGAGTRLTPVRQLVRPRRGVLTA